MLLLYQSQQHHILLRLVVAERLLQLVQILKVKEVAIQYFQLSHQQVAVMVQQNQLPILLVLVAQVGAEHMLLILEQHLVDQVIHLL